MGQRQMQILHANEKAVKAKFSNQLRAGKAQSKHQVKTRRAMLSLLLLLLSIASADDAVCDFRNFTLAMTSLTKRQLKADAAEFILTNTARLLTTHAGCQKRKEAKKSLLEFYESVQDATDLLALKNVSELLEAVEQVNDKFLELKMNVRLDFSIPQPSNSPAMQKVCNSSLRDNLCKPEGLLPAVIGAAVQQSLVANVNNCYQLMLVAKRAILACNNQHRVKLKEKEKRQKEQQELTSRVAFVLVGVFIAFSVTATAVICCRTLQQKQHIQLNSAGKYSTDWL